MSLSVCVGHTSVQSPHSSHLSGLKTILSLVTPSSPIAIGSILKAPLEHAATHLASPPQMSQLMTLSGVTLIAA